MERPWDSLLDQEHRLIERVLGALEKAMPATTSNLLGSSEPPVEGGTIPCFRCGLCCAHRIRLSPAEAKGIADELGVPWEEFCQTHLDDFWGGDAFLLRHGPSGCVFLEREGPIKATCRIHASKPSACRDWTPSVYRRECRQGLTSVWGLEVREDGQVEGPEDRLARFYAFLQSLQ